MRQEKLMIMQLQLDIRESWGRKASKMIKRSMRLLRKVMAILYKGLPDPKGKMSAWVPNAKQELTKGTHVWSSSTIHFMSFLKATRSFCDKMEWVRT